MNIVDIAIIIIFVSSIIIGFARGFVREVISFLSLIAAIVLAIMFSNQLAVAMTNSATVQHLIGRSAEAGTQPASYIAIGISFFLIFMGVLIIGAILGYLLNAIFQFGVLGIGNRFFGGIFGFIRAFIFVMIIIFILQLTTFSEEPWWKESKFVAASQPVIQWLDSVISPALADFKSKMGEKIENAVTPSSSTNNEDKNDKNDKNKE